MKSSLVYSEIETRWNDRVFRALMENANDAIFVLDEKGRILHANRQSGNLLGLSAKEMEGRYYHEFVVDDDLEHAAVEVGKIINGSPNTHSEVRLRKSNGGTVIVEFSSVMVELEGGKVMMSIGRDITEQKRVEEDRSRLAAIVECSNDAIYAIDLEGTINVWNLGAVKLFGYAAEEVIGRHFFMLAPADRHPEIERLLESCKQGRPISHFETFRKNRLQEKIPISVNWFPLRDENGNVTGVSAIVRDLTEPRREGLFLSRED